MLYYIMLYYIRVYYIRVYYIIIYYIVLYYVCVYVCCYTQSPLEDSRLFGPSPWKVLATTYDKKNISEQPSPWRKSCKRESCYGDRVYHHGYVVVRLSLIFILLL